MAVSGLRRTPPPTPALRERLSPQLQPDAPPPKPKRDMPHLPPDLLAKWHAQSNHWMETLDALAPYALALIALAVTMNGWPATLPGAILLLAVIVVLVVGTGWRFFRPLPDSHATWPVALALLVGLFPLMAMHAQTEQTALVTPVPVHLVPLAFTWTALVVIAAFVATAVIVMTRDQPRWAGVVIAPLAIAFGWLPLLVLRATEREWFVAALMTFAIAEVASGIAWFLPERARWFVTPLTLAVGAWTILRDQIPPNQTLPGRPLLLLDCAVIGLFAVLALAAPLICWRITHPRTVTAALNDDDR